MNFKNNKNNNNIKIVKFLKKNYLENPVLIIIKIVQ